MRWELCNLKVLNTHDNDYYLRMSNVHAFAPHLLLMGERSELDTELVDGAVAITAFQDAAMALSESARVDFDLILLDLDGHLPMAGADLLVALRKISTAPVIALSAHTDEQARIATLLAGADDYLPRPFSQQELWVRILVLLRRVKLGRQPGLALQKQGDWQLSVDGEQFSYRGVTLGLTSTEGRLLKVLLEHPQQVLSKRFLYQAVLCRDCGRHDRSLDLHVSNLRRKLKKAAVPGSPLRTIWGQGYTLEMS